MVFFKTGLCSQQRRERLSLFFNLSKDFILSCGAVPEQSCRAGHCAGWAPGSKLQPQRGVINPMGVNQGGTRGMNLGSILLLFQLPNEALWDFNNTEPPESRGESPGEAWDRRDRGMEADPREKGSGESFEEQVTNWGKEHEDIHPTESSAISDTGPSQELGEGAARTRMAKTNGQNSSS